jgi:hypothetical protein
MKWADMPAFELVQVNSGFALSADAQTKTLSCCGAGCHWHLRSVIGLPDHCYMIANGQFLDAQGE